MGQVRRSGVYKIEAAYPGHEPGEALTIELGDDPSKKTLKVVVLPRESIKFGYASKDDEAFAPACPISARSVGMALVPPSTSLTIEPTSLPARRMRRA